MVSAKSENNYTIIALLMEFTGINSLSINKTKTTNLLKAIAILNIFGFIPKVTSYINVTVPKTGHC